MLDKIYKNWKQYFSYKNTMQNDNSIAARKKLHY